MKAFQLIFASHTLKILLKIYSDNIVVIIHLTLDSPPKRVSYAELIIIARH